MMAVSRCAPILPIFTIICIFWQPWLIVAASLLAVRRSICARKSRKRAHGYNGPFKKVAASVTRPTKQWFFFEITINHTAEFDETRFSANLTRQIRFAVHGLQYFDCTSGQGRLLTRRDLGSNICSCPR